MKDRLIITGEPIKKKIKISYIREVIIYPTNYGKMTISDIAKFKGITRPYVRAAIEKGNIPTRKTGRGRPPKYKPLPIVNKSFIARKKQDIGTWEQEQLNKERGQK